MPGGAAAAASCPISYGSADDAKPNKVYLYYPTVADPAFPEFGAVGGGPTSPAVPFDIGLLPSYTGTATALKGRINDVVTDDFCEFNAQVLPTDSMPTMPARRTIVAIGTDSEPAGRWGRTDVTDVGDALDVGNARVWAGTYQNSAGFPGGALEGSNSTTTRWGNAIGGTAAHEAGHAYGLVHNTTLLPGEDAFTRHLMPAGSDVNQEQRAGYRRHFSDTEFSTLAANIGLSIQTMHNWDLIKPERNHRAAVPAHVPQHAVVAGAVVGLRRLAEPVGQPDRHERGHADVQRDDVQPVPAHMAGRQGLERWVRRPGAGRSRVPRGGDVLGDRLQRPRPDHHHEQRAARRLGRPAAAEAADPRLRRGDGQFDRR